MTIVFSKIIDSYTVIAWLAHLNTDSETHQLHWILGNLQCMGSRDRREFPSFLYHWQYPCRALTVGKLPAVRAVQGDCERAYSNCLHRAILIMEREIMILSMRFVLLLNNSNNNEHNWHFEKRSTCRISVALISSNEWVSSRYQRQGQVIPQILWDVITCPCPRCMPPPPPPHHHHHHHHHHTHTHKHTQKS